MLISDSQRFADLLHPRRIWAIGAIHGDIVRLGAIHQEIGHRFEPGDRLVYLGNMLGRGPAVLETVDEILAFRLALLAVPGMKVEDIAYLRGAQEEMWQKLLQLQFAPNPAEVLGWMLRQGLDATLAAYGGDAQAGLLAARDGAVALTRWTNALRGAIRRHPGHDNLMSALRRAAYTSTAPHDGGGRREPGGVLLVHAGIDPERPLAGQGDSFWWDTPGFARVRGPYEGFRRIVRGYDPGHGGISVAEATATIDAGCGFGGRLACACIDASGEIVEIVEA